MFHQVDRKLLFRILNSNQINCILLLHKSFFSSSSDILEPVNFFGFTKPVLCLSWFVFSDNPIIPGATTPCPPFRPSTSWIVHITWYTFTWFARYSPIKEGGEKTNMKKTSQSYTHVEIKTAIKRSVPFILQYLHAVVNSTLSSHLTCL